MITNKSVVEILRTLAYNTKFNMDQLIHLYSLVNMDIKMLEKIVEYLNDNNNDGKQ